MHYAALLEAAAKHQAKVAQQQQQAHVSGNAIPQADNNNNNQITQDDSNGNSKKEQQFKLRESPGLNQLSSTLPLPLPPPISTWPPTRQFNSAPLQQPFAGGQQQLHSQLQLRPFHSASAVESASSALRSLAQASIRNQAAAVAAAAAAAAQLEHESSQSHNNAADGAEGSSSDAHSDEDEQMHSESDSDSHSIHGTQQQQQQQRHQPQNRRTGSGAQNGVALRQDSLSLDTGGGSGSTRQPAAKRQRSAQSDPTLHHSSSTQQHTFAAITPLLGGLYSPQSVADASLSHASTDSLAKQRKLVRKDKAKHNESESRRRSRLRLQFLELRSASNCLKKDRFSILAHAIQRFKQLDLTVKQLVSCAVHIAIELHPISLEWCVFVCVCVVIVVLTLEILDSFLFFVCVSCSSKINSIRFSCAAAS